MKEGDDMPLVINGFTVHTWVTDAKTGEWKQIEIEDIPEEKRIELADKFAAGMGYERVNE